MSNPITRSLLMATAMANAPAFFHRLFRQDWYGGTLKNWVNGLALDPRANILELGCGPGNLSVWLAQNGYSVTGADKSDSMIRRAARFKSAAKFIQADAFDLPMGNAEFDVVLLSSLINIVPDRPKLLAEAGRVLRPGGTISALFPTPEFTITRADEISTKLRLNHLSSAAISLWASAPPNLEPPEISRELIAAGFENPHTTLHLENSIASVTARKISAS